MPWQLKHVRANDHNDNYTVTVEYVHDGATVLEHAGQIGESGGAGAFVSAARRKLQRLQRAAQRKDDAERAGRFDTLIDQLNNG